MTHPFRKGEDMSWDWAVHAAQGRGSEGIERRTREDKTIRRGSRTNPPQGERDKRLRHGWELKGG